MFSAACTDRIRLSFVTVQYEKFVKYEFCQQWSVQDFLSYKINRNCTFYDHTIVSKSFKMNMCNCSHGDAIIYTPAKKFPLSTRIHSAKVHAATFQGALDQDDILAR